MRYRRLGSSGLQVSAVGLGTWLTFGGRVDANKAYALVAAALDRGINLIDTADVYAMGKAEEMLGSALAGIPRKDVVLATKAYFPTGPGPNDKGLSRKHIDETIHASMQRLRTD
jgi:aryl-alcohol dehydrogenase-like predicted oxidoreductase